MTPWKSLAVAITLAASFVVPRAEATTARAVPFDEKVESAEAIVLGKCTQVRSEWDASHRWIVTYSTFKIDQTLKGAKADSVTLVTPGGTVGELHQETVGIRPFRQGEENVIFIRNTSSGPTVSYFDQGTYDVVPDTRGEKTVVPVTTGAVLIDTQRGMAVAAENPRPLREFERAIADSIERGGPRKMELMRRRAVPQASVWDAIGNLKALVALALIGAALSGWQLFKR